MVKKPAGFGITSVATHRGCGAPSFAQHLVPCCFCVVGLANVELSHEVCEAQLGSS
ncbi:TPA: hypothetical protein ACH3X3_008011 [Trebouxia sp. C0006]